MKWTNIAIIAFLVLALPMAASNVEMQGQVVAGPDDFNLSFENDDTGSYDSVKVNQDGVGINDDWINISTDGDDELFFDLMEREPSGEVMLELQPEIPDEDVTISAMAIGVDNDPNWPDEIVLMRNGDELAEETGDPSSIGVTDETIESSESQFSYTLEIPDNFVTVSWSDGADDGEYTDQFHIYRAENAFPDVESDSPIATVGEETYSYTDDGADDTGVEYCYKITAENALDEESDPTEEVADACAQH